MFSDKLTNAELADALMLYEMDHSSPHILYGPRALLRVAASRIRQLEKRNDQLENEITAVEWMNGCIEKELFECRKKS